MTVVVGAQAELSFTGAAYIYVKGGSGWPTSPTTTLSDPAATSGNYFGYSVAVGGNTAVVGAPGLGSDVGTAYIYVNSGSGWPTTPTTTLSDPAATTDDFGLSVAVGNGTVVVGAPSTGASVNGIYVGAAYIYVRSASTWPTTPATSLSDPTATEGDFGFSVAVSEGTAVISAPGTSTSMGAAYFYVRSASAWPTLPTTTLSDPAATAETCDGSRLRPRPACGRRAPSGAAPR